MRFLLVLILLTLSMPAAATTVADAVSGDELVLSDGTRLHLAGIAQPFAGSAAWREKARRRLIELAAGHDIASGDSSVDRYGRTSAQVYVADTAQRNLWLQGEMLRAGLAFVYQPSKKQDEMREVEQAARQAHAGIWGDPDYADIPASAAARHYGSFAFVRGAVLDAVRVKNMVYLNFGVDWHTDFTIAIAAHDLRAFRKAGIDPLDYKGKQVRVRGWIKRNFGPMIAITDPSSIETLAAR